MNFEGRWTEKDRLGAPVTTHRVRFASQAEEVLFLRNMVLTYRHVYKVREWAAAAAAAACIAKRKLCQAVAIARDAQKRIYYVNEGDETFQTPVRTLRAGFGDCDDFSTLVGSGCESLAIPIELVAMWIADPPRGFWAWMESHGMPWEICRSGAYKHIFPRAVIRFGRRVLRVPLDATLRAPAGTVNPVTLALGRGDKVKVLVL